MTAREGEESKKENDDARKFWVRVVYQGEPLTLARRDGGREDILSFDEFVHLVDPLIPHDWHAACTSKKE